VAIYAQSKDRLLSVTSPLGDNVLLLTGFTGREEMSRLFRYQLDLLSERLTIDPADIVGLSPGITWSVQHVDQKPRFFHGRVSRFVAAGRLVHGRRVYRAEVVPWLWFLTNTADCRIFPPNKTIPEIVEIVFTDFGFTDYEFKNLKRVYPKWDYCVQYRETAFNFVSRLLEQEGLYYYFRHEEGKHTMVISGEKSAYQTCAESAVRYTAGSLAPNHISSWEQQYAFCPGKFTQTDYNFETPSTNLQASEEAIVKLPNIGEYEMFDYPGEYEVQAVGKDDARVRIEEGEVPYDVVTGVSRCCTFTPGG
jgi:type VI secretion system secreted protein VgrG